MQLSAEQSLSMKNDDVCAKLTKTKQPLSSQRRIANCEQLICQSKKQELKQIKAKLIHRLAPKPKEAPGSGPAQMAPKVESLPPVEALSRPLRAVVLAVSEVVSKRRRSFPTTTTRTTAFILLILLNLTVPQTIAADSEAFIKVTRFQVPPLARVGDSVRLACIYELQGETLHAMKLFKDDKEFYRYTPSMRREDQRMAFPVGGLKVDMAQSSERSVSLRLQDKRSAGLFKCQVSVEGTFKSVSAERRMEVIDRLAQIPAGSNHNKQQQQRHTLGTNGNHLEQVSTFKPVGSGAVQARGAQISLVYLVYPVLLLAIVHHTASVTVVTVQY